MYELVERQSTKICRSEPFVERFDAEILSRERFRR
jgi:hypothetical protein